MIRGYVKYLSIAAALALCAVHAWADGGAAAAAPATADVDGEIRRVRAELDSAKALLDFYGVKHYTYSVILKPSVVSDRFMIKSNADGGERDYTADPALLLDAKLTFKTNGNYSPYIGAFAGGGALAGGWIGAYAGVERTYIYGGGFSAAWSYGAHVAGAVDEDGVMADPAAGIHAIANLAFNHRRVSPYITVGMRLNLYKLIYPSFPTGFGLSFKI